MPGGGWEQLALGGVYAMRVTGGHTTALREPVSSCIGAAIRNALEGGEDAQTSPYVIETQSLEFDAAEVPWRMQAHELSGQGNLGAELKLYRAALERNPYQPAWVIASYADLCTTLLETDLLNPLREILAPVARSDARLAFALGWLSWKAQELQHALRFFEWSAQLECRDPAPLMMLARMRGSPAEREHAARAAIALVPNDPMVRTLLVEVLTNSRQFAAARRELDIALAMDPLENQTNRKIADLEEAMLAAVPQ
jgi:hypothetical protein